MICVSQLSRIWIADTRIFQFPTATRMLGSVAVKRILLLCLVLQLLYPYVPRRVILFSPSLYPAKFLQLGATKFPPLLQHEQYTHMLPRTSSVTAG